MDTKQQKRLVIALIQAIPADLDGDVAEGWIQNPQALADSMQTILAPTIIATFYGTLNRTVDELPISVRTARNLQDDNVKYIGELVQKNPLNMFTSKRYARKSIEELVKVLSSMNLSLGMSIKGWTSPDGHIFRRD